MPRNDFPGFSEACAQEQRERNGAYLELPAEVCGIGLRQMTPADLAWLSYAENPYATGIGRVHHPVAAQFIFRLASDAIKSVDIALSMVAGIPFYELDEQIDEYLSLTFRDQNATGKSTSDAPIACLVDWIVYRMMVTFKWPEEKTLDTPLRRIWPKLRCWQAEHGEVVINKLSGANTAVFLTEMHRRMSLPDGHADKITESDVARMNAAGGRN